MNSEEFYMSRIDLNSEGEELAAAELSEALRAIDSWVCHCGGMKLPGFCFCCACHFSLPIEIRTKLYRIKQNGDVDLFEQAKALLRIRAEITEMSR